MAFAMALLISHDLRVVEYVSGRVAVIPINPPSGCHFRTRCPFVMDRCSVDVPELLPTGGGRPVACHLYAPNGEESMMEGTLRSAL